MFSMTILFRKTSHWLLRNAMVYKIFFKEDTILTKSIYDKCANEINELITLAELTKDKNHIITVFDNPYKIEAPSGMIFPIEIEDVEAGFYVPQQGIQGIVIMTLLKKM